MPDDEHPLHRLDLEDGRQVAVRRVRNDIWEFWVDGVLDGFGTPLNSCLAETIGYKVAHEEWPDWIDEWAAQVEREPDASDD